VLELHDQKALAVDLPDLPDFHDCNNDPTGIPQPETQADVDFDSEHLSSNPFIGPSAHIPHDQNPAIVDLLDPSYFGNFSAFKLHDQNPTTVDLSDLSEVGDPDEVHGEAAPLDGTTAPTDTVMLNTVGIPPVDKDIAEENELTTDDSDLSDSELESRFNKLPSPTMPTSDNMAEERGYLSILKSILLANGQDMETLDFVGPARTPIAAVPTEFFRSTYNTDSVREAANREDVSWHDVFHRQLKVDDDLHPNHLSSRVDFGGPDALKYRDEVRKRGEAEDLLVTQTEV